MTTQRRSPRLVAALVILCACLFGASLAQAAAKRGDFLKAARAFQEWRYEEARELTATLRASEPTAPETVYLSAQLDFLEGRYAQARAALEGLRDPAIADVVAELLPVVIGADDVTRGYVRRESAHFIVFVPAGKDEVLVELALDSLEKAYTTIGEDLGYFPPEKVRVEVYPRTKDLAKVSSLTEKDIETSGTIALCKYNRLMIVTPRATVFGYPWMDTLAHEYVHYVISRRTKNRVPIWLHEGLAKFQESRWRAQPASPGLGVIQRQLLSMALKRKRLITFEEMHPSMAKLPSQEAATTAFAQVYAAIEWLHGLVGYEGVRGVLERIADGKTEKRAIAEVVGGTWPEAEGRYRQFLKKRYTGFDGGRQKLATRRMVFLDDDSAKETDNVGLDRVSEEKARKFARLGGLLRHRGQFAAAAIEYEKALAITGPDEPFVAAKLARTYLELDRAADAVKVATPIVALDPEDAAPRAILGVAFLRQGKVTEAREHLLMALQTTPFDPTVRCGLAEVAQAQGDAALLRRETDACGLLGPSSTGDARP